MRRLKICLDRKSLQVIYFTFITPIIEYGDVVWDDIPQYLKNDLDKIQNEAARIVTGCRKLVSLDELKIECGWESLADRRRKHKLILFFKMTKCLVLSYLSELVPDWNSNLNNYNLRNSNNIRPILIEQISIKKILSPIRCGRVEFNRSRYKKIGFLVMFLKVSGH